MALYRFKAPALPLPTLEYDKQQQELFSNALRLYFNRLDQYNLATSGEITVINNRLDALEADRLLVWMAVTDGMWAGH